MKVLHVTQNYYPSLGGTQHTMKKVSECLHEMYHDHVTVYTTNSLYGPNSNKFEKIKEQEAHINGVDVKRFGFMRAHKPVIKLMSKASIRMRGKGLQGTFSELSAGPYSASMKRSILDTNADVICASSVHYRFADYGLYRKQSKHPKPFVLYGALHLETDHVPGRYIERIQAADHYIANTHFEKSFLVDRGILVDAITVAGAATDILETARIINDMTAVKNEFNIPAGKKVILCISRQEAFKGLPVLLDAIKILGTDNDYFFVIAGAKGNYSETLQQFAGEHKNLRVLTDISQDTKCTLLQLADIVVLPSKEESFGVVFLEAWSFKKPVIGSRIGAIASLIEENKDGFLFEPGNAVSLAACIESSLQKNNTVTGENGFTKVQQQYTWQTITATFRNAYIKAINDFKQNYR